MVVINRLGFLRISKQLLNSEARCGIFVEVTGPTSVPSFLVTYYLPIYCNIKILNSKLSRVFIIGITFFLECNRDQFSHNKIY